MRSQPGAEPAHGPNEPAADGRVPSGKIPSPEETVLGKFAFFARFAHFASFAHFARFAVPRALRLVCRHTHLLLVAEMSSSRESSVPKSTATSRQPG